MLTILVNNDLQPSIKFKLEINIKHKRIESKTNFFPSTHLA